ncbi:hypothetical protein [Phormidium sp. CCY1219]|nr:hypothetical protein [Phormidium sp. CCY1219]MEB3826665.1 hypothetical protein [Phormidium sp. CCY1219]
MFDVSGGARSLPPLLTRQPPGYPSGYPASPHRGIKLTRHWDAGGSSYGL